MKKGSKLYSITHGKCPHCHEGDFFEGSFFKGQPRQECEVCGNSFSKEPGFYQGSYYVVYALGVAVFVSIWTFIELFIGDVGFNTILAAVIIGILVAAPVMFPLSKIIWANFFFHFKGDVTAELEKHEASTH